MNLTVNDFLDLFTEPDMQEVAIYDLNDNVGEEIYRGTRDEMPSDIQDLEICSVDFLDTPTKVITINVDTSNN